MTAGDSASAGTIACETQATTVISLGGQRKPLPRLAMLYQRIPCDFWSVVFTLHATASASFEHDI